MKKRNLNSLTLKKQNSNSSTTRERIQIQNSNSIQPTCKGERLRVEVSDLKEVLRRQELKDEIIQPSKSEELARELVEPNVKFVDGFYEIPVPLKSEIVNGLTNNFHSAVDRTASLRKKALKDAG